MRRNTLSIKEFLIYSLYVNIVVYLFYRNILFIAIWGLSIAGSHGILGLIITIAFVFNLAIAGRWGRNKKAAIAVTLIPYGVYTFIAYSKYMKAAYIRTIIVMGIIAVVYLVLIYGRRISNTQNRRKVIRGRSRRGYEGVINIVACAGVTLAIIAYVKNSVIGGVTSSQVKSTAVYGDEYALSENIDMILYLRPEEWDKLGDDLDMKMSVLASVVNMEGRFLGFNKEITLYTKDLGGDGFLGYYSYQNNAIYIDTDHILNDSSQKVMESVLHECFHVAQMQYSELYNSLGDENKNSYFLLDAKELSEEFASYVDSKDNPYKYYSQTVESSARAYAKA